MWKYHRYYGYIIYCSFHTKKQLKWNGWYFIGFYLKEKFCISVRPYHMPYLFIVF